MSADWNSMQKRSDIRNVAIIAHVDHGKTTLVDEMLRQSGLFRRGELDKLAGGQHGLILDSSDLERERGITILAKNIAVTIGKTKVNLIDTPGHATLDFPIIYASGRQGIATTDLAVPPKDLRPLYDAILNHVPPPDVDPDGPLQLLVVTIDHSEYVGRIGIGRVVRGKVRKGQK